MSEAEKPDTNSEPEIQPDGDFNTSRRRLIKLIASAGFGHIALIHLGHGAHGQTLQPKTGCGFPAPGDGGFIQNLGCGSPAQTPRGYQRDGSCNLGTGFGVEVYADSTCNFLHHTRGAVGADQDCDSPGGQSGTWWDHDCNSAGFDGFARRDDDCGTTQSDSDCGSVGNSAGHHKDDDCGDGTGVTSPDSDCSLSLRLEEVHTVTKIAVCPTHKARPIAIAMVKANVRIIIFACLCPWACRSHLRKLSVPGSDRGRACRLPSWRRGARGDERRYTRARRGRRIRHRYQT